MIQAKALGELWARVYVVARDDECARLAEERLGGRRIVR
jgi:hypothetical protein